MNVLETAQNLIRIPSVNPAYDAQSPGELGMTDWLVEWAREHQIDHQIERVSPGRHNVIFQIENGTGPHLLLNGHTDTVAVNEMTIPPFGGEVREGRLWGRGSADMKGPLACMLHAFLYLRDHPQDWNGKVTFACVMDEEVTFAGIYHFLKTRKNFDFAIVGEPTNFEVVRGCKGCLRFFARAHGRAAHSSTPEKGASSIHAMGHTILALEKFFAEELSQIRHPDLGCSTGSIGIIQGGTGINIVPETCEIRVDVRMVPGQDWKETWSKIQATAATTLPGIRWEFDPAPLVDFPFCLENDHPLVTTINGVFGRNASLVVNYSCDASKIAAVGIPCVIFGPGDIAEAHTATESIPVDDLERGVDSYVKIAQALLKS